MPCVHRDPVMAKNQPANFVDDPHAPEIFSSGATGFFVANGNITITFESARVDELVAVLNEIRQTAAL